MYTKGTISWYFASHGSTKIKIKKSQHKSSGWTVRYSIEIRAPLRMIDGIERSLGSLFNIEPKRILNREEEEIC